MNKIDELVSTGKSHLENGDFNDALSYFDKACYWILKILTYGISRGATLRSLGRYAESARCFNNSLKLDPRDKFFFLGSIGFLELTFLIMKTHHCYDTNTTT